MFLLLRRADIPSGSLQIDDIRSPSEHSNQGPRIQGPIYLRQPDNEQPFTAVGDGGANERVYRTAFSGLAAYLQDNISDAAGAMLTDADATDLAEGVITLLRSGSALNFATLGVGFVGELGGPPASVTPEVAAAYLPTEILRILSGEQYTVPAGSLLQDAAGNFVPTRRGSFTRQTGVGSSEAIDYYDAYYASGSFIFNEDGFKASQDSGKIAGFTDPTFTYLGVSGAAVTVYNDNGTLA